MDIDEFFSFFGVVVIVAVVWYFILTYGPDILRHYLSLIF